MSMVRKGEMTYGEAKEKFEELGKEFRRKITRRNILDMMESGEITMEESEIELRDLESRENKGNKNKNDKPNNSRNEMVTPGHFEATKQQLPSNLHATIVPPMGQRYTQKPKQPTDRRKEQIAPKYNDKSNTNMMMI